MSLPVAVRGFTSETMSEMKSAQLANAPVCFQNLVDIILNDPIVLKNAQGRIQDFIVWGARGGGGGGIYMQYSCFGHGYLHLVHFLALGSESH